ncbi:MAG: O-acetyl-ADP-ribose deacetylase [Endomicrobiaceae bacterium]|jgi:O-acetyl-ADP-ribose deacetylase (regulator of RNase III)|nr:O-acetyl-ADP-ribose deacetylase [Endomicrobiaceae bacterium]
MPDIIELILEDITKLHVDAVVNAANTSLLGGGGVDGAVHRAAGKKLLEECKSLNGCKSGQAKITAGYNLFAKHIIHTVGPVWRGGSCNESKILEDCYLNSLKLLLKYNLKTIAFPSISTGAYKFPVEKASDIAVKTVCGFLKQNIDKITKVYFVCFCQKDFEIYSSVLSKHSVF